MSEKERERKSRFIEMMISNKKDVYRHTHRAHVIDDDQQRRTDRERETEKKHRKKKVAWSLSIFIHKIAVRSISLQIMLVQLMHMPRRVRSFQLIVSFAMLYLSRRPTNSKFDSSCLCAVRAYNTYILFSFEGDKRESVRWIFFLFFVSFVLVHSRFTVCACVSVCRLAQHS